MKFLRLCSTALVLLLGTVIAHAQGFQQESFPAGLGKPELKYHMVVPEGVTITNKKGEVFKAGQVVVVPGANVTILEPAYVKEQMKNAEFKSSFMNETSYSGMSEEKVRDYAIVSIKVPEGVTVESLPWKKTSGGVTESYAGKTIKGPSSVTLIATKAGMQATPDTTPAESWKTMGGWSGWNK